MGLRSYIETGIALDAIVTYDLLVSIFHPATPLHDGAVVIQGNRVAAAACFLPLTVNPELSRTLGSRHRAAIGVTEDTDAVAIVVSEETGTISLVEGGHIRRGLDGPTLRQALLASLGRRRSPRHARRRRRPPRARPSGEAARRRQLALRVASLALAVGLWFVIAGDEDVGDAACSVPVELQNVPRDLELTGDPVNSVDVRVRASPGIIHSLETGKLLARSTSRARSTASGSCTSRPPRSGCRSASRW